MCIWLPHWSLQETLARRPEWREQPVVLYTQGGRGGQTVVTRSRRAAAQGVRPGMPLAQARAVLDGTTPAAQYERFFDLPVHRARLAQQLAEWCLHVQPAGRCPKHGVGSRFPPRETTPRPHTWNACCWTSAVAITCSAAKRQWPNTSSVNSRHAVLCRRVAIGEQRSAARPGQRPIMS